MPKRPFYSRMTALLLAVLLAIQPLCTPPVLDLFLGNTLKTAQAAPPAQDAAGSFFLPIILNNAGPGGQAGDAPDFVINSPINGSAVGGVTFFAIQPTNGATIDRVTFRAGATDLGADTTAGDGFRVFLNARDLPAGATQLTATASGPGGETTKSINVTLVPNPPQSATIGTAGGVLASEIGSVISLLPGSVPEGTTVTVDELTQAETTARHGIDWESMGVTFLGAQDVQASAPISGPFGMVASAGFGNRVQPGQAVVNYRIAPDADGDGADEIVVVNTASVAPNGDVVADPIVPVFVNTQTNLTAMAASPSTAISGPPGRFVEFAVNGFNRFSLNGNVAHFRSLNSDYEIQIAGSIEIHNDDFSQQYFRVALPYFPPGPTAVVLLNQSTGMASIPFTIEIETLPTLSRSAKAIITDYYSRYLAILNEAKISVMSNEQLKSVILDDVEDAERNIQQAQGAMQTVFSLLEADPVPDVSKYLDDFARMVEVAGLLTDTREMQALGISGDGCTPPTLDKKGLAEEFAGFMPFGTYIFGTASPSNSSTVMEAAQNAANAAGKTNLGTAIGAASTGTTAGSIINRLFNNINDGLEYANNVSQGKCKDQPPPASNTGGNSGNGGGNGGATTGMGSAPPPGGNGFGGSGGSGGSSQMTAASLQQTSPIMVKIYVNGKPTPFTGMTDPGGYFFVPFIPAGEPFTALAIDTATGETRTFKGTGPATGESVFMFFDFFNDDGSGATRIQIGDVITGEISASRELDLFSFVAAPGQRVYFDLQAYQGLSSQVNWQLTAPDGTEVFNTCLGCIEPGVKVLSQGGTYILTVGDTREDSTGTYRFQLWDVPPPNEFTINIGDVISDSVPGPGAGRIEVPGAEDIYRFTANPGQSVFFDLQGYKGLSSQVNWRLTAPDGTEVFNTCLGCFEPGVKVLSQGGTYTLTVGDTREDSIGTYRFQLWNVPPPNEFTINIGDVISDSVPGPGAGRIEVPGAEDIYRFNANPGQGVFFDLQGYKELSSQVNWRLTAPDGTEVFDTCLGCNEPGVKVLSQGGTYILTVGDVREDSAGTYRFQLWDVPPPNEFTISIGDVISNGVPGPGAGNIETPGVEDHYRFPATAGQRVRFEIKANAGLGAQVNWRLTTPNGDELFNTCIGCSKPGVQTLAQNGTYLLVIGDPRDDSSGTYRLELIEQ